MIWQNTFHKFLSRLGGYYLIPHELLHVLAYRLIGKRCHYEWGAYYVQSLQPKNRKESLFVLLFPFVICWGRSEEHTSELQSPCNLVFRLLLEKKNRLSSLLNL